MLSEREREVLSLISRGYTSAEIGRKLYVSHETVRTHARNILTALSAQSRAHAVAIALRDGVIPFPGPEGLTKRTSSGGAGASAAAARTGASTTSH